MDFENFRVEKVSRYDHVPEDTRQIPQGLSIEVGVVGLKVVLPSPLH